MHKHSASSFNQLENRIKCLDLPVRPHYYYILAVRTFFLFIVVLCVSYVVAGKHNSVVMQIPTILLAGFTLGQALLLSHDNEHGQISTGCFARFMLRHIINILAMGRTEMWYIKHMMHHINPNHPTKDPDTQISVLALNEIEARKKKGLYKLMARRQVYIFPAISSLTLWSLRCVAIKYAFKRSTADGLLTLSLVVIGATVYVACMSFLLGSMSNSLIFVISADCAAGFYLGMSFLINHCGMPDMTGQGYLKTQVESSRNIVSKKSCFTNKFYAFILGGLNYQIEHHLWPTMPRYNLPIVAPYVEQFCIEQDIKYRSCSLSSAVKQSFEHLNNISQFMHKYDKENRTGLHY